ncbi:MAG: hypothetical protein KJO44_05520 [Gemmatimonadetes bacterium]|nr:hypothetical protein [Gemmatimonadota bacterium]MBT8478165.1 hypothetical protein [Gemmatimonadota bacterium]NNK48827.1 hypothetical protein [Gemmatimonadota bacterium]
MAVNEDLTGFIREALNRGLPRDEIRGALSQADWPEDEVEGALRGFATVDFPLAVPRPRSSLSAREAFLYLVLFGTLYVSSYSLGTLLFQFINLALPDPALSQSEIDAIPETIRWAVASLVVATPVFLYTAWTVGREVASSPLKRISPVRRWLTYLTLAIAVSIIIGDSTTVVYNLLSGETTARFTLKALTIGAIAGAIFIYYLRDLRQDELEVVG